MFKTVQHKVFSFDVEWIPDPLAAEVLTGVKHAPPHSLPSAFRSLWDYGGASEENPQPYIKTVLCRVVSIAGILRETNAAGEPELKLISLPSDPSDPDKAHEKRILQSFFRAVGRSKPQIVGYNSANADVPILMQRAIVHGISSSGFGQRPDKPWEGVDYFSQGGDSHVDLAAILGKYKNTPSLHEIASISGIPGKLGVSGDSVGEMWLQGKLKEIVDYNEFDAFTTHLVWARMARFADLFTAEQYEQEQSLVRELLETEIAGGKAHLNSFLIEWDRLLEINQRI
ncbi:MAG: 3'-5' exonuclease [Opitutae bacterium]|nr:3'-5' exonuclease [Opitutae bacterium]MBT7852176.1 3'-5' exonuclease [Opitutae bacterium]